MRLKLYSQNCFGLPIKNKSKRFRNILSSILENQYDVIFLQEVFFKRDLAFISQYLENDYSVIYSDGKHVIRGGLVLLIKKNLLKDSAFKTDFVNFSVPTKFSIHAYEKLLCRSKGYLYCHIESLGLHFINVHCVNVFLIPFFKGIVLKQLEELKTFLQERKCFVGGDFNMVLKDAFFKDSGKINLTPNTRTHAFLDKQLDYILCSNVKREDFCFSQPKIIHTGSDHFGLASEIQLYSC